MASSGTAAVTLPEDDQILITREFDAPRHLVYRAWTTPELVRRWWGGHRGEMTVAETDLRVGGAWRYVMVTDDGFEAAFHGEYREIVPNERIVSTEVYEGMPEGEALNTVEFTEKDRRTTLTILIQHSSKEARDAHLESGMEVGTQEGMELLEQVAVSLRWERVGEDTSEGGANMTEENNEARGYQQPAEPAPDLMALDRLVGEWQMSGDAQGRVTYEWMEGGFFLIQRIAFLKEDGTESKGMEVIGHERQLGAEPSADIKSRFYSDTGDTLDYTYELDGDTLTIWFGDRDSPAYYRGEFSDDGDVLAGHWHWPGGGYEATSTRIK